MRTGTICFALLAVVVVIAGCGSSSSSSSSTTGSSTAAASAANTTNAAGTSTSSTTFASSPHCAQLAGLGSKYVSELSNPASARTLSMPTLLKADQAMANASPSPIHADAEYVVHVFGGFVSALTKTGYKLGTAPTSSQLAALTSAEAQFRQPQFQADVHHITAWAQSNCHS